MIRIAVVQTNPVFGAVAHNVSSAIEMMETQNADLYVLPELFNTGYIFLDKDELERLAEPVDMQAGPTCVELHKFSQRHSCFIVYGFAEKADRLYNSSALILT